MRSCELCGTALQEAKSWHSVLRGYHDGPPYLVCTGCGWRLVAFAPGDVPAPYSDVQPGTRWPWRDAAVVPSGLTAADIARELIPAIVRA
jgi:hypothetical protein